MPANSELARLLEHPGIWRGTSVAQTEVLPTGFRVLDDRLPGKGWPRSGLIEILVSRFGVGELSLLLPTLAELTRRPTARWCVWIEPPLEPFAPALAAHGVVLERVLVVRVPATVPLLARSPVPSPLSVPMPMPMPSRVFGAKSRSRARRTGPLWALEQSLGSGACDVAMAWADTPRSRDIRRLQLAAERGRALGVLFRPWEALRETSHAVLRMSLEPTSDGVRATILKSRGGVRGSIEIAFQSPEN